MAERIGKEHEREDITFGERIGYGFIRAVFYLGKAANYICPPSEEEMTEYKDRMLEEEV